MHLDLHFLKIRFAVGAFDSIDFHFVPIPSLDRDWPIDVLEFDPPVRRQRVSLVEFFGLGAIEGGGVRLQGECQECGHSA